MLLRLTHPRVSKFESSVFILIIMPPSTNASTKHIQASHFLLPDFWPIYKKNNETLGYQTLRKTKTKFKILSLEFVEGGMQICRREYANIP